MAGAGPGVAGHQDVPFQPGTISPLQTMCILYNSFVEQFKKLPTQFYCEFFVVVI